MNSYSIPNEPHFAPLHREAEHYLKPVGFTPGPQANTGLQISVVAGDGESEAYRIVRNKSTLTIQADGTRGAAYGFHHALRLLGFGYSFFADAKPKQPELKWPFEGNTIRVKPAFATRGFLPWGNLLNSINVWNYEDYEQYLLTIWRWGSNFVLLHSYDMEPLAAFRDADGKWSHGKPFADSWDPPCGAKAGIPVEEFPLDTARHFSDAKNGVWAARHRFAADPIEAAQTDFRHAIKFADSIGLDVGFGFQLDGDPSTPGYRQQLERRIRHVLTQYPSLHTLCLWESEGPGLMGWPSFAVSPGYEKLHRHYGKYFRYLDHVPNRKAEAVRLATVFNWAYEIAKIVRPSINLAFSGWGGDRWLRWGDYWQGLHECLPQDVTLSQLDNLIPQWQNGVSQSVRSLKGERSSWTTLWVETDDGPLGHSSMWHPQEDLNHLEKLVKSAARLKYSGLFVQNWNTAGVELSTAFVAEGAWNSNASARDFREKYAETFYTSPKVAELLARLEELGAGWTGTSQHIECNEFEWENFPSITTGDLTPALKQLGKVLAAAREDYFNVEHLSYGALFRLNGLLFHYGTQAGRSDAFEELQKFRREFAQLRLRTPHARRLLATMDFVIAYEKIKRQLDSRGQLPIQQGLIKQALAAGLPPDRRLVASYKKGVANIDRLWREVFRAQAARLDTRSDFGTLATIILKAYAKWQEFLLALPPEDVGIV